MPHNNLAEKAAELGFKTAKNNDANQTLAEVIESGELRFWEAFPVLLANAAEGGKFNFQAAESLLREGDRKYLKLLIIVSLALYDSLGVKFSWRERLFGAFPARLITSFRARIDQNSELELGELRASSAKLKELFSAAFKGSRVLLKSAARAHEEESLEAALEQIFTGRQRELVFKKLRRESFTKTEKEYFSRVIKKKLRALANDELHRLARRILA